MSGWEFPSFLYFVSPHPILVTFLCSYHHVFFIESVTSPCISGRVYRTPSISDCGFGCEPNVLSVSLTRCVVPAGGSPMARDLEDLWRVFIWWSDRLRRQPFSQRFIQLGVRRSKTKQCVLHFQPLGRSRSVMYSENESAMSNQPVTSFPSIAFVFRTLSEWFSGVWTMGEDRGSLLSRMEFVSSGRKSCRTQIRSIRYNEIKTGKGAAIFVTINENMEITCTHTRPVKGLGKNGRKYLY